MKPKPKLKKMLESDKWECSWSDSKGRVYKVYADSQSEAINLWYKRFG